MRRSSSEHLRKKNHEFLNLNKTPNRTHYTHGWPQQVKETCVLKILLKKDGYKTRRYRRGIDVLRNTSRIIAVQFLFTWWHISLMTTSSNCGCVIYGHVFSSTTSSRILLHIMRCWCYYLFCDQQLQLAHSPTSTRKRAATNNDASISSS